MPPARLSWTGYPPDRENRFQIAHSLTPTRIRVFNSIFSFYTSMCVLSSMGRCFAAFFCLRLLLFAPLFLSTPMAQFLLSPMLFVSGGGVNVHFESIGVSSLLCQRLEIQFKLVSQKCNLTNFNAKFSNVHENPIIFHPHRGEKLMKSSKHSHMICEFSRNTTKRFGEGLLDFYGLSSAKVSKTSSS